MAWEKTDTMWATERRRDEDKLSKTVLKTRDEKDAVSRLSDVIGGLFNHINKVCRSISGSRTLAPSEFTSNEIRFRAAVSIIGWIQVNAIIRDLDRIRDDEHFEEKVLGLFKGVEKGKEKAKLEKIRKLIRDLYGYYEYWSRVKEKKGGLPLFSKYNNKTPDEVKRILFKDISITTRHISRIIDMYGERLAEKGNQYVRTNR